MSDGDGGSETEESGQQQRPTGPPPGPRPTGPPPGPRPTGRGRARPAKVTGEIRLGAVTVIGRGPECHLRLHHPRVSRTHLRIVVDRHGVSAVDPRSGGRTFVNGWPLKGRRLLEESDRLDVGPFALQFMGRTLKYWSSEGNQSLIAEGLTRRVRDRTSGEETLILHDVSLVIEPNEFVVLLGPSGSGKSTLMGAMSARAPADEGAVYLNGEDLYANFEALKRSIALVPQRDVVHGDLTVAQALRYTAKLRFPADTRPEELEPAIDDVLETVGLTHRRDSPIKHLSGGQVKRVSLAIEVISRPSLLFLDEVTSGLDEQTDKEVMACFRKVADSGKTVVCITHSLVNVERYSDLVVFLTAGGRLAFFGSPAEALEYFGVRKLGDVYEQLETKTACDWQLLFRRSPLYDNYVTRRRPDRSRARSRPPLVVRAPPLQFVGEGLRQLRILTGRYTRTVLADTGTLLFAFGQPLLVALKTLALVCEGSSRIARNLAECSGEYPPRALVATSRP